MRHDLILIHKALDYAQRFVGLPYRWGGDDPMEGFDCSGLVIEMLKSVGILADEYDGSAMDLAKRFKRVELPDVGVLVFFGPSQSKINHVGICLDRLRMLEAGGGSSYINNRQSASLANAFVRIRPINRRKDIVCYCDPFIKE